MIEQEQDNAIKELSIIFGQLDSKRIQAKMTMAKLVMEMTPVDHLKVDVS